MENGLILCAGCRHQQSVIAGTVFQDTHMPLPTWFRAMWHVCANKNGMSAQNLQRLLGLHRHAQPQAGAGRQVGFGGRHHGELRGG